MAARRAQEVGDERAAVIALTGDAEPDLLADLPGDRVGRARMLDLAHENTRQINERLNNWTSSACRTTGWARQMFGEPDIERLWEAVEFCVRLDEDDPVAAWRAHVERIGRRAELLNDMRVDALRFHGPGTDLTVGLLPESRWQGCRVGDRRPACGTSRTCRRRRSSRPPTAPHRRIRALDSAARALRPIVKGLEVRFEGGRIVDVQAEEGRRRVLQASWTTDERPVPR